MPIKQTNKERKSQHVFGIDKAYLFEQLKAFKNGESPNRAEIILWFLEDLNEHDLTNLAAHYASQDGV